MYAADGMSGGHVIMLGKGNEPAATSALRAYPGGLQVGGGVTPENARLFLDAGASHIIVTSYVFRDGKIDWERLEALVKAVGKDRLVLDLSCRKRVREGASASSSSSPHEYVVVTDRWQKWTDCVVDAASLASLSAHCAEFLVHGVDVEGMRAGVDDGLVALLGESCPIPVTYAGGVRDMDDVERVARLGKGRVDVSVGSALDIFGGSLAYADLVAWSKGAAAAAAAGGTGSSGSGGARSSSAGGAGGVTVRHDEGRSMFVATLGGDAAAEAVLVYEKGKDAIVVVDMLSTRVPDAFRGKGVAGLLADAAFAWCRESGYKVRPSCSYISDTYASKHPEVKGMLVE
jgi:phosphoribosylformimino-5-aminoimidazole carboxamide ribotide isomerase